MYLLDTNVWLVRLLGREHSDEVGELLNRLDIAIIHLTDFAYHSIGLQAFRKNKLDSFIKFTYDLFIRNNLSLSVLEPNDMPDLVKIIERFSLDFDDAYQYVAAEKYDLTIVSFDHDFDKTERGRKTPADVLAELS